MTITYPLTLPVRPATKTVRWREQSVVAVSMSPFTLQRQTQFWGGQAWAGDLTLPIIRDRLVVNQWTAFFLSLNGKEGHFKMGDPDNTGPLGVATGSPVVSGADQLGGALVTSGWTPSVTGIAKAGDRIGLTSGSVMRMHKVLKDADSDGSGNATLDLWPEVIRSPANASPIELENPTSLFWLPNGIPERDIEQLGRMTVSVSFMEHLT